jgi:hypothetical protein
MHFAQATAQRDDSFIKVTSTHSTLNSLTCLAISTKRASSSGTQSMKSTAYTWPSCQNANAVAHPTAAHRHCSSSAPLRSRLCPGSPMQEDHIADWYPRPGITPVPLSGTTSSSASNRLADTAVDVPTLGIEPAIAAPTLCHCSHSRLPRSCLSYNFHIYKPWPGPGQAKAKPQVTALARPEI